MSWISMPSFHQRLLSTSHKNNYSTSLWTLHQKEGTHPHPILQFFWLNKNPKKDYQETKRSTTNLSNKRESHITFTSPFKRPQGFCPTTKTTRNTAILSAGNHHPKNPPSPAIGRSCRRPPQKRLFLAPAIEATLRSRQALQPLQAKSVPTLRCDDSSGMVDVVVVWGCGLGKVFWKLSFF